MKKVFLLIPLILTMQSFKNPDTKKEVRALYQQAATEEASCKKLLILLQPFNENNNTLLAGYKACGTMLMAKYVLNPVSKLSFFSKGKKLLEKAIGKDMENAELRFLRFTVQTNAPAFLGYRYAKEVDKLFLLKTMSTLSDKDLEQIILSFLTKSGQLTPDEKKSLKQSTTIL
ncbi:MAG: hypothetical protein ACXWWC_01245 [Chitinophagaceae bacterium]